MSDLSDTGSSGTTKLVAVLTLMAAGRAMTLPFIGRAGDGGPGDPPEVWLMPLIGDAAVGLGAAAIALAMWRLQSPATWVAAMMWNAVAAFDAIAAFIVETTAPWPEFFMLELLGRSMFFAAAAMHLAIIGLLSTDEVRNRFAIT